MPNGEIAATKFYVRCREGQPDSLATATALVGFRTLGVEVGIFEWQDDLELMTDLGPTVGVSGFIGDVQKALQRLNKSIPVNVDYPDSLQPFLGRDIQLSTIGEVRSSPGTTVFIKPVQIKLFTGYVWQGDADSRRRVITLDDDVAIFTCPPVNFVSEYRSFILQGEILDCRVYKGDWSKAPNREQVEKAVETFSHEAPAAYCLDWGVTNEGKTLLIEMNDGYSFGPYGLSPTAYAQMLSARWAEMVRVDRSALHSARLFVLFFTGLWL